MPIVDAQHLLPLRTPPRDARAVVLSAVVPLCDEAENLPELYSRLTAVYSDLGLDYELVFVNDGSRDATPQLLDALVEADPHVVVLHLSRNFGHQAALSAGLDFARGEAVVALDGDLQDPPEVVPELLERWREGYDVVYAVRTKRKESRLKRLGYFVFYRLLRRLSDTDVPLDAGDFCLLDRRALDAMNRLPERSRFVRGLRAFVGFRQIGVRYERDARHAGQAKYTLKKLCALALDGVVSFSSFPVKLLGWLAAGSAIAAVGTLGGMLGNWLVANVEPAGWLVVLAVLFGLFAAQFACLGLLGLYLLKVFTEVKQRPPYIIGEVHQQAIEESSTENRVRMRRTKS